MKRLRNKSGIITVGALVLFPVVMIAFGHGMREAGIFGTKDGVHGSMYLDDIEARRAQRASYKKI